MEQEDAYLTHVPDENGVPQAPEDGGSDDSDEETEPEAAAVESELQIGMETAMPSPERAAID